MEKASFASLKVVVAHDDTVRNSVARLVGALAKSMWHSVLFAMELRHALFPHTT